MADNSTTFEGPEAIGFALAEKVLQKRPEYEAYLHGVDSNVEEFAGELGRGFLAEIDMQEGRTLTFSPSQLDQLAAIYEKHIPNVIAAGTTKAEIDFSKLGLANSRLDLDVHQFLLDRAEELGISDKGKKSIEYLQRVIKRTVGDNLAPAAEATAAKAAEEAAPKLKGFGRLFKKVVEVESETGVKSFEESISKRKVAGLAVAALAAVALFRKMTRGKKPEPESAALSATEGVAPIPVSAEEAAPASTEWQQQVAAGREQQAAGRSL